MTFCLFFFYHQGFFFHGHGWLTGQQGKGGDHLLFTLPLPPVHEHSDIYLQLCMWDDYHIFLIAPLVFTRLLLDEIYDLIELPFVDWWCDIYLFIYVMIWFYLFCSISLKGETGGFELTSTITLVLQANRLTKCVSHPIFVIYICYFYNNNNDDDDDDDDNNNNNNLCRVCQIFQKAERCLAIFRLKFGEYKGQTIKLEKPCAPLLISFLDICKNVKHVFFLSTWFILTEYWSNCRSLWKIGARQNFLIFDLINWFYLPGAAELEFSMEMYITDLVVSFHATYIYCIRYLKILIWRFI